MECAYAALLALARLGELTEGHGLDGRRLAHLVLTALTLQAPRAARKGGEYVVLVESADLERRAAHRLPRLRARATLDLVLGLVHHALETHGVDECGATSSRERRLLLLLLVGRWKSECGWYGERRVVVDGRGEESAVDEREAVVHGHRLAAHDARGGFDAQRGEVREHVAAYLVVAVRTLVLEPHVNRVLLVHRQTVDDRPVVAFREHVARLVHAHLELDEVTQALAQRLAAAAVAAAAAVIARRLSVAADAAAGVVQLGREVRAVQAAHCELAGAAETCRPQTLLHVLIGCGHVR